MVLPGAAGSRARTRRQLVDAAPVSIHGATGGSIRTLIRRIRHSIEILVGPDDFDILEDGFARVSRNGGGIDNL